MYRHDCNHLPQPRLWHLPHCAGHDTGCRDNPGDCALSENAPSREKLEELVKQTGLTPRGLLRQKGALYEELGLANEDISDEAILDAMAAHPELINRPIVVTPLGARLCRPKELVLEILPKP